MPQSNRPLLNTHFRVEFHDVNFRNDINFHSVDGLRVSLCTTEGVTNKPPYFENIILKRAFQPKSALVKWCMDYINKGIEKSINFDVTLLNEVHEPVCLWNVIGAVPIAWGIDELHAQDPKILMESIALKYDYFNVVNRG